MRRVLRLESLEERRLFVTGPLSVPDPETYQNPGNPEDANGDGEVSPIDALSVINVLNGATGEETGSPNMNDVNGDGRVTPLDALLVINRINDRSPSSSVPPESRADRLRQALESEDLPPQISPDEAAEILETLEHGGRWELGERYRNGELTNLRDIQTEETNETGEVTEDENLRVSNGEQLTAENQSARSDETALPVDLNEAISPALGENVPGTIDRDTNQEVRQRVCEQVANTAEQADENLDEAQQRLSNRLDEVLENLDLPNLLDPALADDLLNELPDEVEPYSDILADLQGSLTARSIRDAVYQALSNLDIPLILEQIRVDIGTIVESACNSDDSAEDPLAQLLAGDALTVL